MNGIMIVNKPQGITSHDVVSHVRKILNMRRVGHAGTLDPLATGVLVILIGPSTKLFSQFVNFDKAYKATLLLGTMTQTADIEGKVVRELPFSHISKETLEEAMKRFIGESEQYPPMFSAVRFQGKKLYQLARKGMVVTRQARRIRVDNLLVEDFTLPKVRFYLECSKGTYVRQLAEDIGEYLGCGACIAQIERTRVGPFSIEAAVKLEDIHESHIRPWRG